MREWQLSKKMYFVIVAYERGPSLVEHGILSVACSFGNDQHIQINIQPFKAQVDNVKQPAHLTENALTPHEAMARLHDILSEQPKGTRLLVLGDPSGINYYLNLCEYPNLFKREPPFALVEVDMSPAFHSLKQKTSDPRELTKSYWSCSK